MQALLQDVTAGAPMGGLKWTHKSLRRLVKALRGRKFKISHETVRRLLKALGYSLRRNRKAQSKRQDADRDRQMRYLARVRRQFLRAHQPVLSVDAKKTELIGNFKNAGQTWRRTAQVVLATDFPRDAEGKAIPYGVYDVARNRALIGVGVAHETAAFAVQVIRHWWRTEGQQAYPGQTALLIQADAGGANGYRSWLWKWELQQFANETGLTITVTHYPTSASKWNWIEHRVFCHLTANWAGEPLRNYETVLKFIRTTTTETGLCCRAYLDRKTYATGLKITAEQRALLRVQHLRVLPKWNYRILPHIAPN